MDRSVRITSDNRSVKNETQMSAYSKTKGESKKNNLFKDNNFEDFNNRLDINDHNAEINFKGVRGIKEEAEEEYNSNGENEINADDEDKLDLYDDVDYEDVQNQIMQLKEQGIDGDNEYLEELEEYYNQIKGEYLNLMEIDEKANRENEMYGLKIERLNEDIERNHIQIEEFKEENNSLEGLIKLEINKNTTLHSSSQESSIIEKIFHTLENVDLVSVNKFQKFLVESKEKNLTESIALLRGSGGDYLKRQGAILYFLHLMRQRYKVTRIPQEIVEDENFLKLNLADLDEIKLFETKVKVIYNNDSFLINLESDDKKEEYTFRDLKKEACEVFNIRQENRKMYHIVNDKFYVYCHRMKVWEIHKTALEHNKSTLNWAHMELLDKMSIFMDRNTNINKENMEKSKIINNDEANKFINFNEITEKETFTSEIEDYIRFYRRIESVRLLFKKDYVKIEIMNKYKEKTKKIELEKQKAIKDLELNDDEDITEYHINKKYAEMLFLEEEKYKEELLKHSRKPELPIYISIMDIHLFRLGKFWNFILSLIFSISFLLYQYTNGSLTIQQTYHIDKLIKSVIIYNPIYKHFLRNEDAISNQKLEDLVRRKKDLLIWLDILFNNLVIDSGIRDPFKKIDVYNNFFQRKESIYEIFGGIKISFKSSQPVDPKNDTTIFKIPTYITKDLIYMDEYSIKHEDTTPKYFNSSPYTKLIGVEDKLCDNCIKNGRLLYSNNQTEILNWSGNFGYYEGGHYMVVFDYLMNRAQFDQLAKLIKENQILNSECRFMMMNFNVLHLYFRAIASITIVFEFSTIGDMSTTIKTQIIDTGSNSSTFFQILSLVMILQMVLFSISLFFRILTKILLRGKVRTLNMTTVVVDLIALILVFYVNYLSGNLQDNIGDKFKNMDSFYNDTDKLAELRWDYVDFYPIVLENASYSQYSGFIILLLFLRNLFYVLASPLIYYIIILSLKTAKAIFNIIMVLVLFVISYALILHILLGKTIKEFNGLNTSILITLISILGSLNTKNYGELSNVQYMIMIVFLVLIKFIMFTFIYAIIKETFEEVRKDFRIYKKKDYFKLVGETISMFIKYLFFPFSFYFMIKDFMKYKNIYGGLNLEKFVKEEELRPGLTYHKLIIEKRVVYLIYQIKSLKFKK